MDMVLPEGGQVSHILGPQADLSHENIIIATAFLPQIKCINTPKWAAEKLVKTGHPKITVSVCNTFIHCGII